jgi:hypothetical protein
VLQRRPELGQVVVVTSPTQKWHAGCPCSRPTARAGSACRRVRSAGRCERVSSTASAKRDLVPPNRGAAHVDRRIRARRPSSSPSNPALVSNVSVGFAGLLEQRSATQRMPFAARARLRAVAVVDADIGVRAGRARAVQGHELIIRARRRAARPRAPRPR